jgi:hypothetical protein
VLTWGEDRSPEQAAGESEVDVPAPGVQTVTDLLNEAPASKFHRRTVIISGVGFFTDAYDLFVIGTVAALVAVQWHLSTLQTSWVTGAAILGAFVGAFTFGRIADVIGRKKVYVTVAVIMIFGAVASAFAPDFMLLVIARLVLGLGIGGDYPVSAVFMSEYSNRQDRGRLVGLVFSMQALGLIVGPLVALLLLSSGIGDGVVWRILLGLGAIPAAAVVYLRSKMPESPRYLAQVQGESARAAQDLGRILRRRHCPAHWFKHTLGTPAASQLPLRSPHAQAHLGHGRSVVPLRLRLLREHAVAAGHPERGQSDGVPRDQAAVVAGHVRDLCCAGLPACRGQDGPYRASASAVHRILRHGAVLRDLGHRPGPDAARGTILWPSSA